MSETYRPWELQRDDDAERRFVERKGHVNEITAGTVLEYDGWQWALVSELAMDRDDPKIGFILLDDLGDNIIKRLEPADGCQQHFAAVEHLRGTEHEYWTDVEYVLEDEVWDVRGPIHPDFRSEDTEASDNDGDQEA